MTSVMRTSPCAGFGAAAVPPLDDVDVPPLLDVDVPPLLDVDVPPLDDVEVPPLLEVDGLPLLDVVSSSSSSSSEGGAASLAGSFDEPLARSGSPLPSTPGRFGSISGVTSGVSVDAQAATRIVASAASRRRER
jgi:hypothetical protein